MGPKGVAGWAIYALGRPRVYPPSLGHCLGALGEGQVFPPSSNIKTPLRGELDTRGLRELFGRALLSPSCATPLSLSLVWLPEGLRRSDDDSIVARRSPTRILDRIQTDLLQQSRLDPRSGRSHHSLYMYEYYEVLHMRH
jgi:hypothetical protein